MACLTIELWRDSPLGYGTACHWAMAWLATRLWLVSPLGYGVSGTQAGVCGIQVDGCVALRLVVAVHKRRWAHTAGKKEWG
jgi:hypothetical protein